MLVLAIQMSTAQGPNAPEAASFEPIDATDMVNLVTGDFTYVLPVLNVPSPEGGYPLALSYHAAIAMDQEASWTGLGWNLNAGAINRSINGYPDDYNNSLLTEYFYDEGDEESIYSLSLGYLNGGYSVGLGFSWGSNRSLGGYVSVGYGMDLGDGSDTGTIGGSYRMGTSGNSASVGLTTKGGLSLGVSANSNGVNGSIGFDNNGSGFSVSSNGSINISIAQDSGKDNQIALGLSLSSNGIGINAGVTNKTGNKIDGDAGIGLSIQFANTISMGDYSTESSGWMIPIVVPIQVGVFSLSFGVQKFKYYLGKTEYNYVNGPMYFDEGTTNGTGKWKVNCGSGSVAGGVVMCASLNGVFDTYSQAESYLNSNNLTSACGCDITQVRIDEAFMDIYEIPLKDSNLSSEYQLDIGENAIFPSYDNYNVQAQGLSGGMSSRLFENGNLFGLSNKENNEGYELKYTLDGTITNISDFTRFNSKPYFYFDNEISTYLGVTDVSEANFNSSTSNTNILDYYADDNSVELNAKPRRKNATFIEYFTNQEIKNNYSSVKAKGYLNPSSGFDINTTNIPLEGIGAFMITAIDGKTYHYSLPVYNHETITRTFGTIAARPNENQSYFEKRQLEAYATHWLLTAVTGPDYFDTNDNGIADKGDYGYWTTFEYGKWSDAFVWTGPYGKDYFENEENNSIKSSIKGRKQVYYLDRVKTRTHTALFVKSERNDALSPQWNYQSVNHIDNIDQNSSAYQSRFIIPEQKQLKLDKIILIKEHQDNVNKAYGTSTQNYVDINYNDSSKPEEQAWYNLKDNLIDVGDNINSILPNAIKIIDLQYDNSLAVGRPNTYLSSYGSTTLKYVHFRGKGGEQLMPPYSFDYVNNSTYTYNIEDKDAFGYYEDDSSLWSLNEITTPQGGKIQVNYEDHKFKSLIDYKTLFSSEDDALTASVSTVGLVNIEVLNGEDYDIEIGSSVDVEFQTAVCTYNNMAFKRYYKGKGTITEQLTTNKFKITLQSASTGIDISCSAIGLYPTFCKVKVPIKSSTIYNNFGGLRTASLVTTDGVNSYTTNYSYGNAIENYGFTTYIPNNLDLEEELPYSSELPAPKVMYEYVTMEFFGTDNQSEGKIQYKFKVLKEKDPNDIKFGDLYEIDVLSQEHTNNVANKDVSINKYTVKDNLATLGQLLEVSTYNNEGQTLSKIINTYYSPSDPTPNSVGVTKEAYQTYKIVDYINNTPEKKDNWLINSSARIKYPSLLKYSTEYKSGYEYSSEFGELDPITGQANEILSIASDGTEIKSKSIPAYHKYSQMGSKTDNINNENMLSQTTANYSYIKDPISGVWKETGVGISTWNNNWSYRNSSGFESIETNPEAKVWRRNKEYIWKGELNSDGSYNNYVDNFNWNSSSQSSEWTNISEITKYTRYSSPIELKDINNNRASTKMCDEDSKVLAVSNSWYGEMYYCGAEYIDQDSNGHYFDGEVGAIHPNGRTDSYSHTGLYSVSASDNQFVFSVFMRDGEHRAGKYKISVWVKKTNYLNSRIKINGSIKPFNGESVFAGDWVLLNHYEDLSSSNESISLTSSSGIIYFDDFRIHPVASSVTSYVYNKWDELESVLGENNLATKYDYDSQGRLIATYSEIIDTPSSTGGFKKTSENFYNYKNQ